MVSPILLLASSSPRRQQLLSITGWSFNTLPAELDESPLPGEKPHQYTSRLAKEKARAVTSFTDHNAVILAADTTVADGDSLLGKPGNPDTARSMLHLLRGRTHQVYTALAVLDPASGRQETDLCVTQVPMRNYTDAEIEDYICTGDPLDKAGAYAIQHGSFHPVIDFKGCFASVMGLPLCHLVRTLNRLEIVPRVNVPQACQVELCYTCPIQAAVLRGENVG
jgi:septum formation protein